MTSSATTDQQLSVTVERKPGSLVEMRVEAPAGQVDTAVNAALRRLGGRVRIPGFRPGKAPAPIVERVLGWDAVKQEAVDGLLPQLYSQALDREKIEPVGEPEVQLGDFERGQPFSFTATVTVLPEIELGSYLEELRVPEEKTEITEERVDEVVEELRRRLSDLVRVEDRPVQAGDVLRATLTMRKDGEPLGEAQEERDVEVDRERLVPGLADAMLGLNAGDTHTVEVTLPEDYAREELRGAKVEVEVVVHEIRERHLPPLDDSLAKLDNHGETLDELREHYRGRLAEVAAREDEDRYESSVLQALRDRVTIDVPEVLVDREIDNQLTEMSVQLSQAGLQLERFLEYSGQTIEQVRGERREGAVQRVKLDLALTALASAEGIEIDEADVEREEKRLASGRKLNADQRRRLHRSVHQDLALRGAARRAVEIARGDV
ncbi:MAG TPA: trigger factor [Candidatus Dormibacteraeota bacterium]|nr:trigger factor [Candidatus Dormibacteraeota bacterium]